MKPRITVITLGVDDLERSLRFYRDGLGLATEGIIGKEFEHGAVAFFDLQPGLKLAVWPRESLAADAGLSSKGSGFPGFALAHNVRSPAEVDALLAHVAAGGAKVVKPGHPTDWGGYSGYFTDLDGFLWEVAHNPGFPHV